MIYTAIEITWIYTDMWFIFHQSSNFQNRILNLDIVKTRYLILIFWPLLFSTMFQSLYYIITDPQWLLVTSGIWTFSRSSPSHRFLVKYPLLKPLLSPTISTHPCTQLNISKTTIAVTTKITKQSLFHHQRQQQITSQLSWLPANNSQLFSQ